MCMYVYVCIHMFMQVCILAHKCVCIHVCVCVLTWRPRVDPECPPQLLFTSAL